MLGIRILKSRYTQCSFSQQSNGSRLVFRRAAVVYFSSLRSNGNDEKVITNAVTKLKRRLDVAIVGLPNAGKSQLLNVLTGANVAAVSRKRHTTREGILGAKTITGDDQLTATQLLFVDTPGFLMTGAAKREGLDRDLMVTARREMVAVDYTVIVVDAARRFTSDVRDSLVELMMQAVTAQGRIEVNSESDSDSESESDDSESDGDDSEVSDESDDEIEPVEQEEEKEFLPHQKFAVVLNKVDLVYPKSHLLQLAMEIGSVAQECLQYNEHSTRDKPPLGEAVLLEIMPTFFYTSALKNEGVDDLLGFLVKKATPAEHFEVEPGQATTMLPEEQAEEIIREKIYRCLHKEVPYQIRQQNRLFQVVKDNEGKLSLSIQQDLIVQSKSHQELVHGRGNQTLERIRESAERDMQKSFNCKVALHLHVKLAKSKQRPWSIG